MIKELFQAAVLRQPGDRTAFLLQSCGSDSALCAEVRSLIAAHDQAGGFLDRSIGGLQTGDIDPTQTASGHAALVAELTSAIPDYQMLRICGQGAFGVVWTVRDRAGALRAMKVISLDRLLALGIPNREMQALQHYCRNVPSHPNLVPILHIGQTEHYQYYTMELADDLISRQPILHQLSDGYQPMTLQNVLAAGRLGTDTAVEITLRLLNGLSCLHRSGLIHRDIKPANIIFVNREVKLADVSLVTVARSHISLAGTPQYMPPDEQTDATADTYALGKVLYEMITGRNLTHFPRLPPDELISSDRLDLEKLTPFLVQACAANARDRFPTAAAMHKALLACRFPLYDSPLLELAKREIVHSPDDSAYALAQLHRAAQDTGNASGLRMISGRTSYRRDDMFWAVVDRFVKLAPWLVLLILGLYLIGRLT